MTQPRLLLIDDEPALAEFVANAARESGFVPAITSDDRLERPHELRVRLAQDRNAEDDFLGLVLVDRVEPLRCNHGFTPMPMS